MKRVHGLLVAAVLAMTGLLVSAGGGNIAQAADPAVTAAKEAKTAARRAEGHGPAPAHVVGADAELLEPSGTAWLIYDDDSVEQWPVTDITAFTAAGNKFTSTWGTFYCDIVRMYMRFTADTEGYFSAWNGLSGSTLQNVTYLSVFPGVITTAWIEVDGSTSATGWIGNSTYTFQNTAWIGNDYYVSAQVGVDTNGGGAHGFALTNYHGTGYAEMSWDAMVRARFNGDNVPVELMTFKAE